MVMIRTSAADEQRVLLIMDRQRPIDHMAREADYRITGWTRFDPQAEHCTPSQSEIERLRRPYTDA